jgi:hypothetical protein
MTLAPVNVPLRRPRVTPRRLLLVAAALAVVVFAGYLWTALGYRLDQGSSWWHGADADSRTDGSRTWLRFVFNPGAQVTFGLSIRNPGPLPVTITGVALDDGPAGYQPIFKVVRVAVNRAVRSSAVFDPAGATPLGAMRVGPGMELPVFVTITVPDVQMAPGAGIWEDGASVEYEVLGLFRHQRVPMGFRLFLYSANGYVPR